jgi:tetratricopeptide (TPR) repeat protein
MNKSTKQYKKALDYYNNGRLDKALQLCELSISDNIKNTSAINLKGLLFYLKGELDNAQSLWKMNSQMNDDSVSKKYYEDSLKDEKRRDFYNEALLLIKEMKIREALILLKNCSESDFNSINVNNYMALCYIKLGEYSAAVVCINKVLNLDKNNAEAKGYRKMLIEYGIVKKQVNYKIVSLSIAALCLVAFSIFTVKSMTNKNYGFLSFKNNSKVANNNKQNSTNKNTAAENKPQQQKTEVQQTQKQETKSQEAPKQENTAAEKFPSEDVKKQVESKNYDALYDSVIKWQDKNLSVNDKTLLAKAKDMLINEGTEFFYGTGSKALGSKDYNKSRDYLLKAYSVGGGSYLYPHIIYMLAASYENLEDIENALKYYSEYNSKYSKGDYAETVLYKLALLNKNVDINKAKPYAEKLVDTYPNSMYNNTNIKEILSK